MRTFIAPFRTAASVHPRSRSHPRRSHPLPPALAIPAGPAYPRSGPARVLIANLTSFADSMGFFRHRPMRTIIDDTVSSRPVSIFRRVSSPHTVSPMVDRRFWLSSSNYACAPSRSVEKRRSSLPTYVPLVVLFPRFFPRIFRGASILRSLITIQNNSLKRDTHCNILALP